MNIYRLPFVVTDVIIWMTQHTTIKIIYIFHFTFAYELKRYKDQHTITTVNAVT